MNKQLTDSQRKHQMHLIERRYVAQAPIDEFTAYLADEHDAPAAEGWALRNLDEGFVREEPPKKT